MRGIALHVCALAEGGARWIGAHGPGAGGWLGRSFHGLLWAVVPFGGPACCGGPVGKGRPASSPIMTLPSRTLSCVQVEALLERGADIDCRDKRKLTPAHYAAAHGHVAVIKLLWSKGADLDAESPSEGLSVFPLQGGKRRG